MKPSALRGLTDLIEEADVLGKGCGAVEYVVDLVPEDRNSSSVWW